jgi:hypothetical protein
VKRGSTAVRFIHIENASLRLGSWIPTSGSRDRTDGCTVEIARAFAKDRGGSRCFRCGSGCVIVCGP